MMMRNPSTVLLCHGRGHSSTRPEFLRTDLEFEASSTIMLDWDPDCKPDIVVDLTRWSRYRPIFAPGSVDKVVGIYCPYYVFGTFDRPTPVFLVVASWLRIGGVFVMSPLADKCVFPEIEDDDRFDREIRIYSRSRDARASYFAAAVEEMTGRRLTRDRGLEAAFLSRDGRSDHAFVFVKN